MTDSKQMSDHVFSRSNCVLVGGGDGLHNSWLTAYERVGLQRVTGGSKRKQGVLSSLCVNHTEELQIAVSECGDTDLTCLKRRSVYAASAQERSRGIISRGRPPAIDSSRQRPEAQSCTGALRCSMRSGLSPGSFREISLRDLPGLIRGDANQMP